MSETVCGSFLICIQIVVSSDAPAAYSESLKDIRNMTFF